MLQDNISLQIVDILNKAANILKNKVDAERRFVPYEAPKICNYRTTIVLF